MSATNHYHDRIQPATERLAQLQARDLLANQRRDSKARDLAKRDKAKRSQRVAALVILAGADRLSDTELVGALLNHLEARANPSNRQLAVDRGATLLSGSQPCGLH